MAGPVVLMDKEFTGKVILVTGASSGIGRATAIKLSQLGATLALGDIDGMKLRSTSDALEGGPHYNNPTLDVGSSSLVNDWVQKVMDKFGRIDHVFNCAGVNPTSYPLETTTDEYWDKLVNTNLKGTYNVTRAVIPHMKDNEGCTFVNVSSISGIHASAQQAIYCATKFGIIGFSKCMALELGPRGIRTNVVAPGYIDTPTNAGVVKGGEAITRMEKGTALGRMGSPEEVADVVVWLMGKGSAYCNGSVVEIDGGLRT